MSKTAEEYSKEFDAMYGDYTPDLPTSKAEQAALERFPVEMTRIPYQDLIDAFGGKEYVDFNSMPRGYFQLGYEQALKELALTWKDIKKISRILDIMVDDDLKGEIPEGWGEEEYYEEVLRRFNKAKEEKK